VPLGVLVARGDAPGRRLAFALHLLPGFLPPYLLALGWFHLVGRTGFLGSERGASILFSEVGAVAVLTLALAPLATALTALGAWGLDASLEEAARVTAPPGRVLALIVLPAATPGIALAAVLIFALALSEVGVPMFLRVDAYPAAVLARLGGIDFAPGEAVALALPLGILALGLLALERRLVVSRDYAVLGLRGAARAPLPLGAWRLPAAGVSILAALLAVAPLLALGIVATSGGGFADLSQWIGGSLGVSLLSAACAATAIVVLGVPLAHALVRQRPGARLVDGLAILAFVTPSAVLGGPDRDLNRPRRPGSTEASQSWSSASWPATPPSACARTQASSRRARRGSRRARPFSAEATSAASSACSCPSTRGVFSARGCSRWSSASGISSRRY
jgi:ABC-type Fe3+ transport system permease subunit